jgi:hypothetical protein
LQFNENSVWRERESSICHGTVVLALALGVGAAQSDSRLFVAVATMGIAPLIWGASHLIERLTGRDLWHFAAPYPYRWMREAGEPAVSPPARVATHRERDLASRELSPAPLAA